MADLPVSAEGSGEGMVPVAAAGESTARAAQEAKAPAPSAPAPLAGGALWGAGFLLSLANFIVLLDTTIANVSVPNIAGGLGVSANEGTWVITSYSVAEAITVPLTGWLAQRFGAVRVFATAMALFGVFSALCGLAPSLNVLVVFRVFQGLSGGPMIPLSQTLLLRTFPKAQAGQAMALWAMTTVVAPIAGPILGGTICDNASWPWIFYINVPVALVSAFLAWRALNPFEDAKVKLPIDVVGLGLMIVWISALQIMLDKGEDEDWFNSPFILTLLIVAVIGFLVFLIWELTEKTPIINLNVFNSSSYTICLAVMCLAFGSYFAAIVVQPLWLQTNLGYTASWAGYAVAPSGVLSIFMSPIVAKLMAKYDPRVLIFIGLMGLASTMFWRSGFASNINFLGIALPQLIQGAFTPMFFVPLFSLALSTLSPKDLAGGAGLLSFARTMAGAFGTSISTTAWNNGARSARVHLLSQTNSAAAIDQITRATGFSHARAVGQFDAMMQNQAVMVATDKLFMTVGALIALASFSIWLTKRPRGAMSGGGGH
jgi:MFS transporter, DHA2 family, multidrug resistance protein